MKTVELYSQEDPGYDEVCAFACALYERQLLFTITHFPEYFFAIQDTDGIVGCIGLNSTLTSPLFLHDKRIADVISNCAKETKFCEQSIFALDHYSLGVPILIAVITEYAHSLGIDKLVYAGIKVSIKTIARLGFAATEIGPVDLSMLTPKDRKNYDLWNETQNPVTWILNTQGAQHISRSTFNTHAHRIQKSQKLVDSLCANYAQIRHQKVA